MTDRLAAFEGLCQAARLEIWLALTFKSSDAGVVDAVQPYGIGSIKNQPSVCLRLR
jgi:hypothetical protein